MPSLGVEPWTNLYIYELCNWNVQTDFVYWWTETSITALITVAIYFWLSSVQLLCDVVTSDGS